MTPFEEKPMRIEQLCASRFDLIHSFHSHIFCNDQRLETGFADYMPEIMLCTHSTDFIAAPEILFIGSTSSQRQLFGSEWADKAIDLKKTPDPEMEERSVKAYRQADDYGYSLHISEGSVETWEGPKLATFARHITTVRVANGAKLFCVAGILLNLAPQ